MPSLSQINQLDKDKLKEALLRCCGSESWATKMMAEHPFSSEASLFKLADAAWSTLSEKDWLEAFSKHPKIGAKADSKWSTQEQAGVTNADNKVLEELKIKNAEYEKKFGFVFLVCATGKSASEMLSLLKARLPNSPQQELVTASKEHTKITHLRLKKWLTDH